ncbi:MAG: RloB family protein [Acidobacteria bacterium]|nr:RloB family protein [Acidobacteriota bacterium]
MCEGAKTEPDYLRALKQEPAVRDVASVDIRIDMDASGAAPLTLVNAAADARASAPGPQGEIDEVWCLFDVEAPRNHPNLDEAVAKAEESDVRLAISNPCFELWLALHFADRTAWLDTADAVRLRREHDRSSGKGLDGAPYMPRRTEAATRARALAARHERDGTEFPNDNPSSGMFRFLAAVERND